MEPTLIGIALVSIFLGSLIGLGISKFFLRQKIVQAEKESQKLIENTKREMETNRKEAELSNRDEQLRLRQEFEESTRDRREELQQIEKKISQREENIEKKWDLLERKEEENRGMALRLEETEKRFQQKSEQYHKLITQEKQDLEKIARLSAEDAKQMLLRKLEDEVKYEKEIILRNKEKDLTEKSSQLAQRIISIAIQRCAADHSQETTITTVQLPSDDMKGRIIGREGRNIRTLEAETGCDLIIDDTPETVVVSGFDPVRREIARLTLERLVTDGRIHPTRIEEVCNKVREEVEQRIKKLGEDAILQLGLLNIHPEIIKLLGRLHYRTSYGQNVLLHSIEAATLMGNMAAELGLDEKLAKRIGLLHDIGKAIDREVEGSHAIIGGDLAKKYGESPEVVHGIAAHHSEIEQKNVWPVLAEASDAISAARPGARGEVVESYFHRVEKLEEVALSFPEVERAFVIQAGREVRCVVEPENVDDIQIMSLARNISKKIEEDLQYPGQIKVTIVRETRAVDYAK